MEDKKELKDYEVIVESLKDKGMNIGENAMIFSKNLNDTEPYLVTIGNNVKISYNVSFVTHDASSSLYLGENKLIYGEVRIGDNCFIGANVTVMPGVTLAKNIIVGAGSVVSKSFDEEGIVIAGVPAKRICQVQDLKEKNEQYAFSTLNMTEDEKKNFLLSNKDKFKKV